MLNSTAEVKKDIREIYDQVPESVRLMSEAVPHLLAILELEPSNESEGIKSRRTAIREEPQLMYKELAIL